MTRPSAVNPLRPRGSRPTRRLDCLPVEALTTLTSMLRYFEELLTAKALYSPACATPRLARSSIEAGSASPAAAGAGAGASTGCRDGGGPEVRAKRADAASAGACGEAVVSESQPPCCHTR